MKTIDRLIITSPYQEPRQHWYYESEREEFKLKNGRREAGYVIAKTRSYNDPGEFKPIPLVNNIRPRIKEWREAGYPGVTSITKRLLEHWNEPIPGSRQFFFCQLEAIETLIWLVEAPEASKHGLAIESDGGEFQRLCSKMATGSGKTIVMALLIAWQVINKVTYPQDARFSKNVFIVAPGLTVRSRLEVLIPSSDGNYYDAFDVVPVGLHDQLRRGKVIIRNWHVLNWDTEEKLKKRRSVDKRGPKSDEAYVREVLGEMARANNIIVINDEAHHAWREVAESKTKGVKKEEIEEATIWEGGLDRIHAARNIQCCYDFSATPFAPSGKQSYEGSLFTWIVSDFSLNDAIESGLVKTPRIVIRDNALSRKQDYRSTLFHLYEADGVRDDFNRKAEETEPLPDIVNSAYYLLGKDWKATYDEWMEANLPTPPVMITVANRTETAARIANAFARGHIKIPELKEGEYTLHIDSKVLKEAEEKEEAEDLAIPATGDDDEAEETQPKLTKKQVAELLRRQVDTVGQKGEPGGPIRNVISVGMLSEGWDAKTVTHIMGLRAFSSQLLCEQVVGRGLRRTSYELNDEGLFDPEYVNVFGVPFTFLPHETDENGEGATPPKPTHIVETDPEKREYEISWPNILRLEKTMKPELKLDWKKIEPLVLDIQTLPTLAEVAPTVAGKANFKLAEDIDFMEIADQYRLQTIMFDAATRVYDDLQKDWKGSKQVLLAQLLKLANEFIQRDKIRIDPPIFEQDELKKRVALLFMMTNVVRYIGEQVRFNLVEKNDLIFDGEKAERSTSDMYSWYTTKPVENTRKSHINLCVYDSTWEQTHAFALDHNKEVQAWAKNDHLGFVIYYQFAGSVRKYFPDFLVDLNNGHHLILETKGKVTEEVKEKKRYAEEWVAAVNEDGRFGTWHYRIAFHPSEVDGVIAEVLN